MRIFLSLVFVISIVSTSGCNSIGYSYVHELGANSYLVEANFDPRSTSNKKIANMVMEKRAEVACGGSYEVLEVQTQPDLFWEDVIILWEVSCHPDNSRFTSH